MKKSVIFFAVGIGVLVLFVFLFIYIKLNQPLVDGTVGTSYDKHAVVIEIGNKGFIDIKITSVLVNHNESPKKLKVQVSNILKGLIIADSFKGDAQNYGLKKITSVTIQPNTSPQQLLEKKNMGTATNKDKSYGLSIIYNKSIETVRINYRYLGFSFVKTVSVN
ncbi:hypothetical protein [Heyndrickxia acidicola]|uniref:Late embryogenesis abundant protein LEA-2 subgroup domain-containing protein n=1 Tax=Heyndrickxia acidicola TaxID=209389 RepID=A0ABU6MI33_9BACI|nr:hypothetical protein [Heyndrickxia acidicola]MED1204331.1 hypothetical protein [Heyndrickxia acidicola]